MVQAREKVGEKMRNVGKDLLQREEIQESEEETEMGEFRRFCCKM